MRQKIGGLTVLLLFCWAFTGRTQVTTGTISGTVTDSTGAVMPGAKIVIQNEDTGISRTVTTDAAGRYLAPSLGLGNYRVTASMEGFQTEMRRGIVLTVGREAVVNLQLSVGAVTQTVEITGEAPLVQTTEATVSYLVNDRTVRDLPLNGRDLSQLILLNPGVTEAVNGPSGNFGNGWGKKISIAGMRSEDNVYLLDGTYIGDFDHHLPTGPSGSLLGAESTREFQVLTNSYGAQYGRTLGGVVNTVSKSGTNEWHGSAYEFLRNSSLDARNFFDLKLFPSDPRLPPFRRNQFGSTLGGPIKKDKTFFFVAYEGMRESLTNTQINVVPDANARLGILPTRTVTVSDKIKPYLPLFPLPSPQGKGFGDGTAQYIFQASQPTQDDFGQGRMDHQFSGNDSLFGRFTGSDSFRSLVFSYPGLLQVQVMRTRLFTLSQTHIFSSRMLNNARFSFNRVQGFDQGVYPQVPANLISIPGQPAPQISPGGGVTAWAGYDKPYAVYLTNRFDFYDDVNLTLGAHSLQLGGAVERVQLNTDNPNRPMGVWTFNSLETFLAAQPTQFRGTPPTYGVGSVRGNRQWIFGLYLQDDWRVTPKLTLNLGLRYEPYTVATEVNGKLANLRHLGDATPTVGDPWWLNQSGKDFGPRIGFAWSPFSSGRTSVRGGFGLVYMPIDTGFYRVQSIRTPPLFAELQFPTTGHFPDGVAEIAAALQSIQGAPQTLTYERLKTPRTLQYNLNVQRQLGASNILSLGYTGNRGINLTAVGDYNTPILVFDGVSLAAPTGATRLNQNFAAITAYGTNADSWYNAWNVAFQRRFSRGLQVGLAYTFSKAISTGDSSSASGKSGGGGGTVRYPVDMRVSKGVSGFSVANVLSINYSYDMPFGRGRNGMAGRVLSGWQLMGIVSAQAGAPFSVTASAPSALSNLGLSRTPNQALGFTRDQIIQGGPEQYFNPAAYSLPSSREIGNVGRTTLRGPGLAKWDFGVAKGTRLTERWQMQFRAEAFNTLNRANFGLPAVSIFTGSGGRVGSAGTIDRTVTTSRQVQLSLKLLF